MGFYLIESLILEGSHLQSLQPLCDQNTSGLRKRRRRDGNNMLGSNINQNVIGYQQYINMGIPNISLS